MSNELKAVAATEFSKVTVANREATNEAWLEASNVKDAANHFALLGHYVMTLEGVLYLHLGNELMPMSRPSNAQEEATFTKPIALDAEQSEYHRDVAVADLIDVTVDASLEGLANNILDNSITFRVPYSFAMVKVGALILTQEPSDAFYTDDAFDGKKVEAWFDTLVVASDNKNAVDWLTYAKLASMLGL